MKSLVKIYIVFFFLTAICTNSFSQNDKALKTINGKEVMLHKVQPKETWTGIARTYNLSIDDLKAVNPGIADLKQGQIINVPLMPSLPSQKGNVTAKPADTKTADVKSSEKAEAPRPQAIVRSEEPASKNPAKHTVKEKETLFGIARIYGVKVDDLKKWNNNIQTVKIGQVINVRPDSNTAEPAAAKTTGETKPATESKPIAEVKEKPVPQKAEMVRREKVEPPAEKPENTKTQVSTEAKEIRKAEPKAEVIDRIKKDDEPKSSSKSDVKTKNGSVVKEFTETGMAAWIKDGTLNQNKYYALHRTAPLGTIVKVNNRMNGDYVFVKVVGQLPDTGDNEKQIIKISEAAAKKIGAVNEHFQVELNYGVLN